MSSKIADDVTRLRHVRPKHDSLVISRVRVVVERVLGAIRAHHADGVEHVYFGTVHREIPCRVIAGVAQPVRRWIGGLISVLRSLLDRDSIPKTVKVLFYRTRNRRLNQTASSVVDVRVGADRLDIAGTVVLVRAGIPR